MKTAEYYRKNPEAQAKRAAYRKKYNKRPDQRKKRSELVKLNREKGTYGNGDGKDVSHPRKGKKGMTLEAQSKNRGDSAEKKKVWAKKKKKGFRLKKKK